MWSVDRLVAHQLISEKADQNCRRFCLSNQRIRRTLFGDKKDRDFWRTLLVQYHSGTTTGKPWSSSYRRWYRWGQRLHDRCDEYDPVHGRVWSENSVHAARFMNRTTTSNIPSNSLATAGQESQASVLDLLFLIIFEQLKNSLTSWTQKNTGDFNYLSKSANSIRLTQAVWGYKVRQYEWRPVSYASWRILRCWMESLSSAFQVETFNSPVDRTSSTAKCSNRRNLISVPC